MSMFMQTYTGKAFYPLNPKVEDIDPVDIAHALSMLCRYGGHSQKFYSVGEHCVLMSEAVLPESAAHALLHDAAEAYMGDMIRPLKVSMPWYRTAEDVLMGDICTRFKIARYFPLEVRDADNRIVVNEHAALMPGGPHWNMLDGLEPLPVEIHGWDPPTAERKYLDRMRALGLMW